MARDSDALKMEKWAAESGDVQTPEDRGLTRSIGWPADFSQPGGRQPTREVFNQIFRELSAQGVELNIHGLLEWDAAISYVHPALVMGSNAKPYLSVQDSTGQDPVTDASEMYWQVFEAVGPRGYPGTHGTPGTKGLQGDPGPDIEFGLFADRPAAGDQGRTYVASDGAAGNGGAPALYQDNGTAWELKGYLPNYQGVPTFQRFTSSGTLELPPGATYMVAEAIGGGAGGEGGSTIVIGSGDYAGYTHGGHAGGGGANVSRRFPIASLSFPLTVTVGSGGSGGDGQVIGSNTSRAGAGGGDTLVADAGGNVLVESGGAPDLEGGGLTRVSNTYWRRIPSFGGLAGNTNRGDGHAEYGGGSGGTYDWAGGGSVHGGSGGGGGGRGMGRADRSPYAGKVAGSWGAYHSDNAADGEPGTSNSPNGADGTDGVDRPYGAGDGGGGGGGGYQVDGSTVGNGGTGGSGGIPGGGGGGGGGSGGKDTGTHKGGDGGDGGRGEVRIWIF